MKFNGDYKTYYNFINTREIIKTDYIRVRRNYSNLGLWIVKDSQNKYTLNLWIIRIQF